VPFWAKDAKSAISTINARAEEAATKPAFREALKMRRSLVPADAYYEWRRLGAKTKHPFAFALASGEPYAFAGLWETWQPPEGALLETFTILTTVPNSLTEPIHDRMPVIIEPKDYDRWMDPPLRRLSICSAPTRQNKCARGKSASRLAMCAITLLACWTRFKRISNRCFPDPRRK